jgi:hypothetical protein
LELHKSSERVPIQSHHLKKFYCRKIQPHVSNLVWLRIKSRVASIFDLLCLAMFFGLVTQNNLHFIHQACIGFLLLFWWVQSSKMGALKTHYKSKFKDVILKNIFRHFDSNIQYHPYEFVDENHFKASELCLYNYDHYSGENLVEGKVDGVGFQFSMVTAHGVYVGHKGNRQWTSSFHGLFFAIEFNKKIKGVTHILPDMCEPLLGKWLGNNLQAANWKRGELVKLENSEFEKTYTCYSDDPVEARYILTPHILERFVELRKTFKKPLQFSFAGKHMYLAIPKETKFFEPSFLGPIASEKKVEKTFEMLQLIASLAKELQLDSHIWLEE